MQISKIAALKVVQRSEQLRGRENANLRVSCERQRIRGNDIVPYQGIRIELEIPDEQSFPTPFLFCECGADPAIKLTHILERKNSGTALDLKHPPPSMGIREAAIFDTGTCRLLDRRTQLPERVPHQRLQNVFALLIEQLCESPLMGDAGSSSLKASHGIR